MVRQQVELCYAENIADALTNAQSDGYRPLFMPEIAQQRIHAENDSPLWKNWLTSQSLIAVGKQGNGTPTVVFAHIPHYLSTPGNIREAKRVNGAVRLPQSEFDRLVSLKGSKVSVLQGEKYEAWLDSASGLIRIADALDHPQVVPFLGLKKKGAERYLKRHAEVYNTTSIGVWHTCDSLDDGPSGRLPWVGSNNYNGLYGYNLILWWAFRRGT